MRLTMGQVGDLISALDIARAERRERIQGLPFDRRYHTKRQKEDRQAWLHELEIFANLRRALAAIEKEAFARASRCRRDAPAG